MTPTPVPPPEAAPGAWQLHSCPLEFLSSLPAHGDPVRIGMGPHPAYVVCRADVAHRMLTDSRTFDKGGPFFDKARVLFGSSLPMASWRRHRWQRRQLRVIGEVLRLYPAGWFFTRVTTKEATLARHRLPTGTALLYSAYLLHHQPDVFPDPDRFDPDRWLARTATASHGGHGERTGPGYARARSAAHDVPPARPGRRHVISPVRRGPPRPPSRLPRIRGSSPRAMPR